MQFYATLCRLCESPDSTGSSWTELFSNKSRNLLEKIRACANVSIFDNDGLPQRICGRCHQNVEQAYNFRMQCEIADLKLRHEMEFLTKNGTDTSFNYDRFLVKQEHTNPEGNSGKVLVKTEVEEEEDVERPVLDESEGAGSDVDMCAVKVETQLQVGKQWNSYKVSESEESDDDDEFDSDCPIEMPIKRIKQKKVDKDSKACDICGEEFDKKTSMYAHKRTVHDKQRFQCKQCLKFFSRKSRLEDHEIQHTGIRQFGCPQCEKKYATQSGLKTHMEDAHTENQPYVCDKCGKGFSKEGKLRYHYAVHIETRDFICDLCDKGFKTQGHLNLHKTTHLPEDKKKKRPPRNRRKTCVCPFCGKVSLSIGVHSMHIRTHTGEQRYECHICFKRFTSSGSHKKHLRVHTGEKPYECEYCRKTFRQKHHMDTHIRGVHTNEKPYQCKFCPRAFATLGNMRLHERSHGEPAGKQDGLAPSGYDTYPAALPEIGPMLGSPASQSSSMMVNSTPSPMMNPGVLIPSGFSLFMADRTQ